MTMTSMLRVMKMKSMPRAMSKMSPLTMMTRMSTPRRVTLPRATAMMSPLLRAKTTMSMLRETMMVNTMTNIR